MLRRTSTKGTRGLNHDELPTDRGAPIGSNEHSLTAEPRRPGRLHDIARIEELAHFDREDVVKPW